MPCTVEPGDIVFTRRENIVGKLIRFFSQHIGESRTKVNHVALGWTCDTVIEAVDHVRFDDIRSKKGQSIAVYRPLLMNWYQVEKVRQEARYHLGEPYGYVKIVAHFLDWMLLGAYVFRRLAQMRNYPICSWLVADAFAEVGMTFGVAVGCAEPDDIWDYVLEHPLEFQCIRPLSPYAGE